MSRCNETCRRVPTVRVGSVVTLLAGMLLATFSTTAVGAATFVVTVTVTADSNNGCASTGTAPCSLRDAVAFANMHTDASDLTTITLPANANPYALTARLNIQANLTINGGGANATVINGAAADRISSIIAGVTVTFNDLTLSNGHATTFAAGGGALYTVGTTTLNRCIVSNNVSSLPGGGIASPSGTLALNNSVVSNNSAVGSGGGVYGNGSAIFVTNSTFTGNHVTGVPGLSGVSGGAGGGGGTATGGAIAVALASAFSIAGSSFTGNNATGGAGGIGSPGSLAGDSGSNGGAGGDASGGAVFNGGVTLTLTNSTFTMNQATGGTGGNGTITPFSNGFTLYSGGTGGVGSGGAVLKIGGTLTLR